MDQIVLQVDKMLMCRRGSLGLQCQTAVLMEIVETSSGARGDGRMLLVAKREDLHRGCKDSALSRKLEGYLGWAVGAVVRVIQHDRVHLQVQQSSMKYDLVLKQDRYRI